MSIKSILVHADSSQAFECRMQSAVQLGQQFDAHVIALYVIPSYTVPTYAEVPIGPEVVEAVRQAHLERAEAARESCLGITARAGIEPEWRTAEGGVVDVLNQHARYSDLAIVGQENRQDINDMSAGVADHVALESGSACLVIPYIGRDAGAFDRVLVAWNGSAESARAARDAIPIMRKASQVEVVSINPERSPVDEGEVPGIDISAYLARHDINVEVHVIHNRQISAGDILLSHAADMSADLMVMGAYGHNRLRERVLGGVTRTLIEHMTIPVFMSH